MIRQVLAFVTLCTLVVQLFFSSGYLLDYYVNTDFYKEHCRNKDKPELNCDGKCILAEKIAASNNQQEDDSAGIVVQVSSEYLFNNYFFDLNCEYRLFDDSPFEWYSHYDYMISKRPFRPPWQG